MLLYQIIPLQLLLILITTFTSSKSTPNQPPKKQPNLIIYLADDLGIGEVSQQDPTWGFPYDPDNHPVQHHKIPKDPAKILHTPGITKFAQQGIRLFNSHSPSAVCAPSRASIFTGRDVGWNFIRGNTDPTSVVNEREIDCLHEITWTRQIKNQGYQTYYIGKWGLGTDEGHPARCGFDYFIGFLEHGGEEGILPFSSFLYEFNTSDPANQYDLTPPTDNNNNGKLILDATTYVKLTKNTIPSALPSYTTCVEQQACTNVNEVFTNKALEILNNKKGIGNNQQQPFFLVWAPPSPHTARWTWLDNVQYNDQGKTTSPYSHWKYHAKADYPSWNLCEIGRAAMIEYTVDGDITQLLNVLESSPSLNDNTLIIFTSDNGPPRSCDPIPLIDTVSFFEGTGGLNGRKELLWEGGTRVSTMVRWMGKIPPGTVSKIPHLLTDLIPSIFEGLNLLPLTGPHDGVSLWNAWINGGKSDTTTQRRLYFSTEICRVPHEDVACATATYDTTQWPKVLNKLLLFEPKLPFRLSYEGISTAQQLFDLVADPLETNTLLRHHHHGSANITDYLQSMKAIRNLLRTRVSNKSWQDNSTNIPDHRWWTIGYGGD
jgi:arylsulfatase A